MNKCESDAATCIVCPKYFECPVVYSKPLNAPRYPKKAWLLALHREYFPVEPWSPSENKMPTPVEYPATMEELLEMIRLARRGDSWGTRGEPTRNYILDFVRLHKYGKEPTNDLEREMRTVVKAAMYELFYEER